MMRTPARAAMLVALATCAAAASGCSAGGDRDVLAIERTRTYHTKSCAPVHMAKTVVITAAQANALHYAPCPVCKPDIR